MLGIEDEWTAWQLDETCLIVGREIENEKADPHRPAGTSPKLHSQFMGRRAEQFAAMKMPGIQKMQIPENGIW